MEPGQLNETAVLETRGLPDVLNRAERDFVALGIAAAALIMFVGTGGEVLPQIYRAMINGDSGPDRVLISALLLNVALIIFGWRRYRELTVEIAERRKAEAQARQLAETDPLTGCLNRRSIATAGERLLASAGEQRHAVAVMMLDLDNFKQVNDLGGHSAGDLVLRVCAGRIVASLPAASLVARLGGDEFGCFVPFDPTRPERIDQLAADLIDTISDSIPVSDASAEISVSIGIARSDCCEDSNNVPTLLHMADVAMYQAKRRGKNRSFWFEPNMESELRIRSELENGIRRGVSNGEFVPFYEKQIDLETGELVGYEMLARWNSPVLGLVKPEVFIPVAEEIGVIGDLSENLIRQALEDAKHWDPDLTLSVNISPVQLRDPWFAQRLLKILLEAKFPPNRLDIEITESCLHEEIGLVRSLISSLKNQGIKVSLDDFGTGYSSLAQLRALPFDRIKIDRSFITALPGNRDAELIVQAITSLSEGMGLPVTAEGIETEEVLVALRKFGKFNGQGYLYGQPQPANHADGANAGPSTETTASRGVAHAPPRRLDLPSRTA